MELELGLAPPNAGRPPAGQLDLNAAVGSCSKRAFAEAFGTAAATLPLFVRGDVGGETTDKKKEVVGWPPVRCGRRRWACRHVKVKMEGVAIGRKVDMALHASYDQLLHTLHRMFPTTHHDEGESRESHYVVTYQDGDGDWMLLGDVPWDAFARFVKRLKILA